MDKTLFKGLELGVAFAFFVAGLVNFYFVATSMEGYFETAKYEQRRQGAYTRGSDYGGNEKGVSPGSKSYNSGEKVMKIDELYYLLLENQLESVSVDGRVIHCVSKRLELDNQLSAVEAVSSLGSDLAAIGHKEFSVSIVSNGYDDMSSMRLLHK